MAHRFESCRLRQCNDWSLVHLVTDCARAYKAIYMRVCVLIYKKGVDYLCSYITHLKEVHLRYSHITTFTQYDTVHTHFDIVHTHFGTVHTLFTSYDTFHIHFDIDHTHFDTVHTHLAQFTHCSQAMT